MTIWDMGGQDKIRHLWRHYFTNTDALIFVLDSSDTDRLDLARDTLQTLLTDPLLTSAPVLILANKQDLPHSLPPGVIADKLGLYQCRRVWYVQPACALSGEGLDSMLRWLASTLKA
jgi:GTPase SAR1 family protein